MFRLTRVPFYVGLAMLRFSLAGATSAGSCYDMSTRAVTCNVAESACSGSWYAPGYVSSRNGCCHCRASCENTSDACSYYDDPASAGSCYDMSTHAVTCNVAESACSGSWYAPGYVSSRNGCCHCPASCEDTSDACSYYDDVASTSTTGPRVHGCYDVSTRQCACGGEEQECAASGGTWTDGCPSCNGGPTVTTTDAPASASIKLRPGALFLVVLSCALLAADAGTGCYDHIDTHGCDCTVDEQHCTEVRGHYWTDGCRSCDAAEDIAHPECDREHSWGCFDQNAHACECAVSQNTCNQNMANKMSWTHQCWSCCHHSVWGCYVHGSGCLCDIAEGACARDFPQATWSFRCHECMGIDTDPVLTGDDDDDSWKHTLAWIAGSCVLVLTAVAAALMVYCARQRGRKDITISTGPGKAVVVGSPLGVQHQAADPNPVGKP